MKLSIVVPVFCGELTIRPLFEEISKSLIGNYDFEVIFVWDCGPDNSWDVIRSLKKEYPEVVKGVRFSRNYGQHNAIISGFGHASGDFIITMDEDLQHNPKDIKNLIKHQIFGDYDVVYGYYKVRRHAFWRNITSSVLKLTLKVSLPDLSDNYSAFRLIRKNIAESTCKMQNSYTFLDGYLTWITSSFGACEVGHNKRLAGKSGYSVRKLIEHTVNILVTFSNLPIRLLTILGFCVFMGSFAYSIYIVVRAFIFSDLQAGYPSLIIVLLMGISTILMGLGVIGEYIFRINQKVTKRPVFSEVEVI